MPIEKSALEFLIRRHQGHRRRIAEALGVSEHVLRRAMRAHGLEGMAGALALSANRCGPRTLDPEAASLDRESVMRAFADASNPRLAAASLGISINTLYRRRREYEITAGEIAEMRGG